MNLAVNIANCKIVFLEINEPAVSVEAHVENKEKKLYAAAMNLNAVPNFASVLVRAFQSKHISFQSRFDLSSRIYCQNFSSSE